MIEIIKRTVLEIVRKPVYWIGLFILPLFMALMLVNLMENGLPTRIPVGIVDMDHTQLSRDVTQNLNGLQMVSVAEACESFTAARHKMQRGDIYGYFLIPQNFERDLLSGRTPTVSFYTNMTYYVPASLLYKNFKLTAVYTKAGVVKTILSSAGMPGSEIQGMLVPITVATRPLNNPQLNYGIYLSNSFLPCAIQLMIFLITCYLLGQEIKYGTSVRTLRDAGGSVVKAVAARLLPTTVVWLVIMFAVVSLLYRWAGFPMNGSWGWLLLSEFLFVLAAQGFALFIFCVVPNLRLSLSMCALVGVLSFSLGAFSFPLESMYGSIGIFSYILPVRYNFLIYIDQALNGIDIYYSRYWFVAYFIFILLPFTMLWRLKRVMRRPVYIP
jgi:ABC-2 type transport system permease protein